MSAELTEQDPQEKYEAQWNALIDRVNKAIDAVFAEDDHPCVVLGAQWGRMGEADWPGAPCQVTSNLSPHATPEAVHAMLHVAQQQHAEAHDAEAAEGGAMTMPEADVPQEVKDQARALIESLGLDPSTVSVEYAKVVSTDDLSEAVDPSALTGAQMATIEDEQPGKEGGLNTAEREQDFESGSEQEG